MGQASRGLQCCIWISVILISSSSIDGTQLPTYLENGKQLCTQSSCSIDILSEPSLSVKNGYAIKTNNKFSENKESVKVTFITPQTGSLAGGTKLTIYGEGFSTSNALINDAETGNQVFLVGESGNQLSCPVQIDETSGTQLRCNTPNGMSAQDYSVHVMVNGEIVADLCGGVSTECSFTPSHSRTPMITEFTPRSSTAGGTLVTISGAIKTDVYGQDIQNAVDNESSEKLLRVTVGPLNCELLDGTELYGLSTEKIECLTQGTSVGFFNASFFVSGEYGMSDTGKEAYRVSYKDDIYLYQVYTVITFVSPRQVSTEGGAILRVNIDYIYDRPPYVPPTVFVGDTVCTVTSVAVDEYVECEMAADPHDVGLQIGNRGVTLEQWGSSNTVSDLSDILSLTSNNAGYTLNTLDGMSLLDSINGFLKMTAFYTPTHSGRYKYKMYVYGGEANLYVNKTKMLSVNSGTHESHRFFLVKGTRYLLEVVQQSSGATNIEMGVKFYDTKFTDNQLSVARNESQMLNVNSTKHEEIQELSFSDFEPSVPEFEVQVVNISTDHQFRLGLYEVYTEPLELVALLENNETVGQAFNLLPVFAENENVVVAQTNNPDGISLQFTFESGRGDFPDIEVLPLNPGNNISYNVIEEVKGQPDMEMMSLTFAGRISEPFNITELTDTKIYAVIEGMFRGKCPEIFTEDALEFNDYENDVDPDTTDAFCGQASLKNPEYLYNLTEYRGIDVTEESNRFICFAYKGTLKDYVHLKFTYHSTVSFEYFSDSTNLVHTFPIESPDHWNHTCLDMFQSLFVIFNDTDSFNVHHISLAGQGNIFVDTFYVGSKDFSLDPDMSLRRLAPVKPNGVLFSSFSVTTTSPGVYKVTMVPVDCDHNFPLFMLANGKITSGNASTQSISVVSGLSNGREGSMSVTRLQPASPPVTGYVDVTFENNTKTKLDVTLDSEEFKRELETLNGIGSLNVTKSGDCADFDFTVDFVSRTGDLPEMQINDNNLRGTEPRMKVYTRWDGSLEIYPLPGDMVATVHNKPQVRAYVNGVPTACSGDCTVEWVSEATPTVISATPTSGTSALGTILTITGSGFNPTNTSNTVVIGGVSCTVTMATDSSIQCNVGNGPVGSYKVKVNVEGKGYAAHSDGDVTFYYTASIESVNPTSSDLGGGLTLTLSGYGFKSGAVVTINSQPCEVLTNEPHQITCSIPAQESPGNYTVVVSSDQSPLMYENFTYEFNQYLVITDAIPEYIGVGGWSNKTARALRKGTFGTFEKVKILINNRVRDLGVDLDPHFYTCLTINNVFGRSDCGTITIYGSEFGNQDEVYIGNQSVNITSWTENQIIVVIGPIEPGIHEVKVQTDTGCALLSDNTKPTIQVELTIKSVYPQVGSIQGGTELTIKGVGFGTDPGVVGVSLGEVPCVVSDVEDSQIICMTDNAATVHHVTNHGVDPAYGIYYAFDRPFININKGDFVHWSWTTPTFVNNVNHAIIQINKPSKLKPKEGGFSSGTPSSNGQYIQQFTETGIYYVWSGYVDNYNIKNYIGTVNVGESTSTATEIKVKVHGKYATHDVGGASDPTDTSSCRPLTTGIDQCNDPLPSGGNLDLFYFVFWTCSTPIITHMDPTTGTSNTAITLQGEGLSNKHCNNQVMLGSSSCEVSPSSTASSVTCTWDKTGSSELGVLQPVSVRVSNRGFALISIMSPRNHSFGLFPSIESLYPDSGSLEGGTVITISGFGFGSEPMVLIGGYPCTTTEVSFSEIQCKTPHSNNDAKKDVDVLVMMNGAQMRAECEISAGSCHYSYKASSTPSVSAIEPTSMSATTTFTVTGKGFGNGKDNIEVLIGNITALVQSVKNTQLTFTIDAIPVGPNIVTVSRKDAGLADCNFTIEGEPLILSITPTSGSIHGQQAITIQGHGFIEGQTTITLGSLMCTIVSISLTELVIISSSNSQGVADLLVTSDSIPYTPQKYTYDSNDTPTILSIIPKSGLSGTIVTLAGSSFTGGDVIVSMGGVACSVMVHSNTEIQCTVGDHATGAVPVYVHVAELGASNTDVTFEYQLSVDTIQPTQGGVGGGQRLTVTGTGFTSQAVVKICGEVCQLLGTNTTQYICRTPELSDQVCSVTVSLSGLVKTSPVTYTYDSALTPTVESVAPARGGTGGGFIITITGEGFGTDLLAVHVSLDDSVCTATALTNTEIQCTAGPHLGPVHTNVDVEIGGNGIAKESSSGVSEFEYFDVWSSIYTWGGGPLPGSGEIVVIPAGHTVLLDIDTPVIKVILIQGGILVFDERDIELNAEIILITDGGVLQVGTEDKPFQHKASIILHGHVRSKDLPIYGTKCIAVRNGTLDLHGIEHPIVWTHLAETAPENSTTVTLTQPVSWSVGDDIVIATTGARHSQNENEQRTITNISQDGLTLTLDTPLSVLHAGTGEWFSGRWVEFRAEVGLLTRNVVVQGDTDPQWEEKIDACPAGFYTGQFATQTCFLGRHGEELGTSQYGAHVILHTPVPNSQAAVARLSYVEFAFVGQAFRLGRYPVHFYLNGDMSRSYVKGCSIHKSFNRAVNIHGSHNTLVDNNVIYDIMGGAFVLEDGIETGNIFQYNLAIFVRASSSLLNDDITPASFWVTNPDNTIQHNAAAGGTHFGFWYRLQSHPKGHSSTKTVCCKNVQLGRFYNNSAHSFGWYGLWIFPGYFPTSVVCNSNIPTPAVFEKFFAWNNNKGAESVKSWTLQFDDFTMIQNSKVGYHSMDIICKEVPIDDGPMVRNSLFVGQTSVVEGDGCTQTGLIIPKGLGFQLRNVTYANFTDSGCKPLNTPVSSWNLYSEAILMADDSDPGYSGWRLQNIVIDKDGTLTNRSEGGQLLPDSGILPLDCTRLIKFIPGTTSCPFHHRLHKFSFYIGDPLWLCGKNLTLVNSYGNTTLQDTSNGHWTGYLVSGHEYDLIWEDASPITNITFKADISGLSEDDSIIFNIQLTKYPDQFSVNGGKTKHNESEEAVTLDTADNGQWEWINDEQNERKIIKFPVRGTRTRPENHVDCQFSHDLHLQVLKCVFPACILPPDPETTRPIPNPDTNELSPTENAIARDFEFWHTESIWRNTSYGYVVADLNVTEPFYGVPRLMDNVTIPCCLWIKMNDTDVPKLRILILEGILEICEYDGWHYELSFDMIIIRGGRLIAGWRDDPFDVATLSIELRGNLSSPSYIMDGREVIRAKTIAVFGGLDLFGNNVSVPWTGLAATVTPGSNHIELREPVSWSVGDEIVIGPTGYNPSETETMRIVGIADSNRGITLNTTLKYRHIGHSESIGGRVFEPSAPVGLLTRTIKITGDYYSGWEQERYGPTVQVGRYITDHRIYRGFSRLSNIEFIRTGHILSCPCSNRRTDHPSVTYKDTIIVDDIKPSQLSNCTFRESFATAIKVSGLKKLEISHNVIAFSKNKGIQTSSDDTVILHNMVTGVVEDITYEYEQGVGIDAHKADMVQLHNNTIAGVNTIGIKVSPLKCGETSNLYQNNWVQAGRTGLVVFPNQDLVSTSCVLIKGFNIWKQRDYGLYYNNKASLVIEECVFAENGNGIMVFVIGPDAAKHEREDKNVEVRNSLLIGITSSFECSSEGAIRGSGVKAPNGGMIGIVFPSFTSSSNRAPSHSWSFIRNYPSIAGRTKLTGVTFAHYKSTSCNGTVAVSTNQNNDDGQHPIEARGITLLDVDENYKIAYHEPNLRKINPADCLDMDCDGLKKALFKDLDGSFIGSAGSVIPFSEFEWDGDTRRGLGDYRIPKTMVTYTNGTRIPYNTLMPNKGIYRSNSCHFMSSWHAYKCYDTNYQMLILESMDSDSETRRISPVALLGNGYIDLVNGPQDHGWCSHYACRKRLSTFMAIVSTGLINCPKDYGWCSHYACRKRLSTFKATVDTDIEYLLHFTGTTPRSMRYHLLYVEQDAGIKLTVWYERSNRLDVYVDGSYVISTNAELNSLGFFVYKLGKGNEYIPTLDNTTGTNYYDRDTGLLSIIIKGPSIIDVKTKETIIVSFGLPAMTVEDFFGENLIENLANFFDIPLDKVRIVDIVSASGTSSRRRRRQSDDGSGNIVGVDVEIGDDPNATTIISNYDLKLLARDIINECQLGDLDRSLNSSAFCDNMSVPAVSASNEAYTYISQRPTQLTLYTQPTGDYEGHLLMQQPVLHTMDSEGIFVSTLGTKDYPWQLTVSIKPGTGHPNAVLSGTLTVSSVQGWFYFTDLQISHMGLGYILEFQTVYPDLASNFSVLSSEFVVTGPQVYANVLSLNIGTDLEPYSPFTVTLDLRNTTNGEILTDIDWRAHSWTATVSMLGSPHYATLEGTTYVTFEPDSGQGYFSDLQITHHGVYYLQFRTKSSPVYYDFTLNQKLMIKNTDFINQELNYSKAVELKFDAAYDTVLYNVERENELEQFIFEDLIYQFPQVYFQTTNIARGSIKLQFEIAAVNETVLDTVLETLCDIIYNGSTYDFYGNNLTLAPYMHVDNNMFYGVLCHAEYEESPFLTALVLGLIAAGAVLLIVIITVVVVWRKCVKKRKPAEPMFSTTLRPPSAFSMRSARRSSLVTPISDVLDDDLITLDVSLPTNKQLPSMSHSKPPVTKTIKPVSKVTEAKEDGLLTGTRLSALSRPQFTRKSAGTNVIKHDPFKPDENYVSPYSQWRN